MRWRQIKFTSSPPRHSQQLGIGLPAAIFVITVMAGIAVAINLLVEQNAETYVEEINLTRAFYAAESGAGIAMNTLFPPEDYPIYPTPADCVAAPAREYSFTVDGLNQCVAAVTCSAVTISGTVYATIESTGTCGDVARTIQVRTVY